MTHSLTTREVRFRYPDGPDFHLPDLALGCGLHQLDGANGTGKSTMLRVLAGDLAPTQGTVRVNGEDPVSDVNARQWIGHAPYPDDLPEFLRVGRCLEDLAALRRCPQWSAEPLADALALPLDLPIKHASAGQRRKAGLLAAFVGDPPVLLLDEPWAALDTAAIDVLCEDLQRRRTSCVVLFTTHGESPLTPDSRYSVGSSSVRD